MFLQHAPATGMHHAGRGADLGVVVGVDVVHQEIDQAALLLQHGQEADDLGVGPAGFALAGWGRAGRFGLGLGRGALPALRQEQSDQDQQRQRQGGFRLVRANDGGLRRQGRAVHCHDQQDANDQSHSHCGCLPFLSLNARRPLVADYMASWRRGNPPGHARLPRRPKRGQAGKAAGDIQPFVRMPNRMVAAGARHAQSRAASLFPGPANVTPPVRDGAAARDTRSSWRRTA